MKDRPGTKKATLLPNAPLVEVVFELRWLLPENPAIPSVFWNDPAFAILAENFAENAKRHGLKFQKEITREGGGYPAYSIVNRYYIENEQPFPIWQLGNGIFASNDSATYEWSDFKKRTLKGIVSLFESYPKMKSFKPVPFHIELRYVDALGDAKIKNSDLINFLNTNTEMSINLPHFLESKEFEKGIVGSLAFEKNVSDIKNSKFIFKVASGKVSGKDTFVLESKLLTIDKNIKIGGSKESIKKYFSEWLERAHSITSPFFGNFVSDKLMATYKKD